MHNLLEPHIQQEKKKSPEHNKTNTFVVENISMAHIVQ